MTPGRQSPSTLAVVLAMGTVYIVWGSTYLAIAYVVETLPPFLAAGARFLLAGAILGAFLLAQDRWRRSRGAETGLTAPRWVEWRTALIVGVLLLLGGNGMVMVAEQTIPSGIAAVIIATLPIWMALFEAAVTRRRPSMLAVGGLIVGMAGVAILVLPEEGIAALDPVGIGMLVLANIAWAAGSVYARRAPTPASQLTGSSMQQLAGGASLVAAALLAGETGRLDLGSVSLASWLGLAYLVVFGSLLAFTAYVWLLNNVAITTVSTYAYVNPIVAVALGMLFRGEQLTPRSLLAAALIIGAVVAMVSGRPREAEEPDPSPDVSTLEPEEKSA
ncbi:MAG TPA: EamA family transporter [Candidatus Limnocylindria bacterium]|nr:EamA family transporter [Candidatus Limnocylindria bacterium]